MICMEQNNTADVSDVLATSLAQAGDRYAAKIARLSESEPFHAA